MDEIRQLMDKRHNIRNIWLIDDTQDTYIADSLIARAGIVPTETVGCLSWPTTCDRPESPEISTCPTYVSLRYIMPEDNLPPDAQGPHFLINFMESEDNSALCLADAALITVKCHEGVQPQTEMMLRKLLSARIKPILCITEIQDHFTYFHEPEQIYQQFAKIVSDINAIITAQIDPDGPMSDFLISPDRNLIFSVPWFGFGFTLDAFGRIYAKTFGVSRTDFAKHLWGDEFWEPKSKQFLNQPIDANGKALKRSFCLFILKPLLALSKAIMDGERLRWKQMVQRLSVSLDSYEDAMEGRELLATVLRKWLPLSDALLETVVLHAPSPVRAQKYRTDILYTGPPDDECAQAMRNCDSQGPLMLLVAGTFTSNKGNVYGFGRVFSGTLHQHQKIFVVRPTDDSEKDKDVTTIEKTTFKTGRRTNDFQDYPSGNEATFVTADHTVVTAGCTISTSRLAFPCKL